MGWVWSPSGTGHPSQPPRENDPNQDPPHGAWSPLGPLCQDRQSQFSLGKGEEGKGGFLDVGLGLLSKANVKDDWLRGPDARWERAVDP